MLSDATEAALGLLGLTAGSPLDTVPTIPLKRRQSEQELEAPPPTETIDCICGFAYDDGFSIACDSCSRWCHSACFDIVQGKVPDVWECWVCRPRFVDRERAVRIQMARMEELQAQAQAAREKERQKRRASPGVERKRRTSAAAIDPGRRKRRASINAHHPEDEHVDIDEPWTLNYVPIDKDIVPHDETRDRLRRVATHWRGVTAIEPDSIPPTPPIGLSQLPSSSFSHPALFSNMNASVLPPSYSVHASQPIRSANFITPFTSTVIPSSAYLSDPLNAYAHLGMPKPFVHLLGPPLDVALDARFTGDQARFVRSGCRPNAVLRPMICRGEDSTLRFGIFALRDLKAHEEIVLGWEWDDGNVIHHLPALIESSHAFPPQQIAHFRYQMTSMLHALSSTFTTCACGSTANDCALNRMAAFVDSQSPPTPSPSPPSSFSTQFPGARPTFQRDRTMSREEQDAAAEARRQKVDLGPLIGVERGFRTRERVPMSGGIGGVEMVPQSPSDPAAIDPSSAAGPSSSTSTAVQSSVRRKSNAKSRRVVSEPQGDKVKDRKGKGRATGDEHVAEEGQSDRPHHDRRRVTIDIAYISPTSERAQSAEPMDVDDVVDESRLPPKMRKGWIHKSLEALRDASAHKVQHNSEMSSSSMSCHAEDGDKADSGDLMEVDAPSFDFIQTPPPPRPPLHRPQSSSSASPIITLPPEQPAPMLVDEDGTPSPSIPFANLSLLSPVTPGPSSLFSTRHSSSPLHSTLNIHSPTDHSSEGSPTGRSHFADDALAHAPTLSRHERSPSRIAVDASAASQHSDEHKENVSLTECPVQPSLVKSISFNHVGDHSGGPIDVHAPDTTGREPELTFAPAVLPNSPPPSPVTPSTLYGLPPPPALTVDSPSPSFVPGSVDPASTPLLESVVTSINPPSPPHLDDVPITASPSPQPPRKVKLSLKDFALRKKRQREEEFRVSQSPQMPMAALNDLSVVDSQAHPLVADYKPVPPQNSNASASPTQDVNYSVLVDDPGVNNLASVDHQEVKRLQPRPISTNLYNAESLRAKAEVMEAALPSDPPLEPEPNPPDYTSISISLPPEPPPVPPNGETLHKVDTAVGRRSPSPIRSRTRSASTSRSRSRSRSRSVSSTPSGVRTPRPLSRLKPRRYSSSGQEDGEIIGTPPQKVRLPHTPPTHPRSFQSTANSPPTAPSARWPAQPAIYRPVPSKYPSAHARPLPSGPRALRAVASTPSYPSPSLSTRTPAPQAPQGPSADRERDRDRERERVDWERERSWGPPRGRGRGKGGVWGR